MAESEGIWFVCPRCGASNVPGSEVCFLCHRPVDPAASAPRPVALSANPYAAPADRQSRGRGFHLDSMLLIIALIAVCMGVIHEAPGLGIPLAVISFIALARTVTHTTGNRAGRPASVCDKVAVFFATVGIVLIVLICVFIALFATCLAIIFVLMPAGGQAFSWPAAISIPIFLVVALGVVWLLIYSAHRLGRVGSAARQPFGRSPKGPAS
jgi:hypothetical protein